MPPIRFAAAQAHVVGRLGDVLLQIEAVEQTGPAAETRNNYDLQMNTL